MSKFSDYTEANIIEATLRGASFPVIAGTYIALFINDPTDANVTGGEVQTASWPTYVRKDCSNGSGGVSSGWNPASNGVSANAKLLSFPANNGPTVIIGFIGIYDAATGGNLLYHAPLVTSKTLLVGDVLAFAAGSITVTVA